jgi:hypothetical protein
VDPAPEFPLSLLTGLDDDQSAAVRTWWSRLEPANQITLVELLDPQREECAFGFFAEAPSRNTLSVRTQSFLGAWTALDDDWEEDFREYLDTHDATTVSLFPDIHINPPRDRRWHGMVVFSISGRGGGESHIVSDWALIRCASWLLPPSELAKRPGRSRSAGRGS